jgi:hypothetical protein
VVRHQLNYLVAYIGGQLYPKNGFFFSLSLPHFNFISRMEGIGTLSLLEFFITNIRQKAQHAGAPARPHFLPSPSSSNPLFASPYYFECWIH